MRNPSDEDWLWRAHYTDGTTLEEYPDDGPDHAYKDIDLARCYAIELVPQRPHLTQHIVKVDPTAGMRVWLERRRIVPLLLLQEGETPRTRETITVLGWRRPRQRRGKVGSVHSPPAAESYTFYFPDGTTLHSDQYNPL